MKFSEIVKVLSAELGSADVKEINQLLKKEAAIKFRITGKALGHFGFTGEIKSVSELGVKVYTANKVTLIRLEDIEGFDKAKPKKDRPVRPAKGEDIPVAKSAKGARKPAASDDDSDFEDDADDDEGDDFSEDLRPKKMKNNKTKPSGKSGSKFIPTMKK